MHILAVYTAKAQRKGGNAEAVARNGISHTRDSWRRSGIQADINLVGTRRVEWTEPAGEEAWQAALPLLTLKRGQREVIGGRTIEDRDGAMDEAHGWRDALGADLVVLYIDAGPGSRTCGTAWAPDFGGLASSRWDEQVFSVVDVDCVNVETRTTAHELGHNQGGLHDPSNTPRGIQRPNSYPDRFGTCDTENNFNTVMAYPRDGETGEECSTSTGLFSNPALTFRGIRTGELGRRNNVRVLNLTAARVAAYRERRTEPPPEPPVVPPNPPVATGCDLGVEAEVHSSELRHSEQCSIDRQGCITVTHRGPGRCEGTVEAVLYTRERRRPEEELRREPVPGRVLQEEGGRAEMGGFWLPVPRTLRNTTRVCLEMAGEQMACSREFVQTRW